MTVASWLHMSQFSDLARDHERLSSRQVKSDLRKARPSSKTSRIARSKAFMPMVYKRNYILRADAFI
jgi:hypothetical protein